MDVRQDANIATAIREAANTLSGGPGDYDPLLKMIGNTRFVLNTNGV